MKTRDPKKPDADAAKTRGLGRVFQRGDRWWIQYSWRGHQHRESAGSTNRAKAVSLLKHRLAEMGQGRLIGSQAERLTWGAMKQMVLDDHQLNGRKSKPPLARLTEYFPDYTRTLDITADVVKAYIGSRIAQGAAPATVRNEVAVLGRAFTLA